MTTSIILKLQLHRLTCKSIRNLQRSVFFLPRAYYSSHNITSGNLRAHIHREYNINSHLLKCSFGTKSKVDTEKSDVPKSGKDEAPDTVDISQDSTKLGLFARFKLMYKQYWYILIPVHVITSIAWFGGFYYLSKSGVDIPSLLQTLHVSESIIEKLKGSQMGHIAVAYLCYKIATPARYAVTVGGTTISIKYLVQAGYIKPLPTKTDLIRMYEEKKAKRKQEKDNIDQ